MTKLLIHFLLFSACSVFAQDSSKDKYAYKPYTINGDAAYNYQNCSGAELGINIMTEDFNLGILLKDYRQTMEFGAHASCEFNFINSDIIAGPKTGIGMNHMVRAGLGYSLRLNLIVHDPGFTNDIRFCPQLGMTFLGMLNIYYGYNMPLGKDRVEEIGYNKITVNFNLGYKRMIINTMDAVGGF